MTVNTTLSSLSQTASANGPDGAVDAPSTLDDAIRYTLAFIAKLRDDAIAFGATTAGGTTVATAAELAAGRNAMSVSTDPFRNRIINGDMSIDQRNSAAAQTITAAAALAYCVDRHYAYCTGANVTGQQITASDARNRYRFTGAASVTAVGFGHRIEAKNSRDLASTVCTLSAKLSSSSLTTVNWAAYYANTADTFGTLASPTRTSIASGSFTITSTETVYSTQITMPSGATTGIEIVFTVGALLAAAAWTIGDVQLEKGTVLTAAIVPEVVDAQVQLARCQRYYATQDMGSTLWTGNCTNTAIYYGNYILPVTMRALTTGGVSLTDQGASNFGGVGGFSARGDNRTVVEQRTCTASGVGNFGSIIKASAEL